MKRSRPPIILSTLTASLILGLMLVAATWTSPNLAAPISTASNEGQNPQLIQQPNPTIEAQSLSPIPIQPQESLSPQPNESSVNSNLPDFESFVHSVTNGQAGMVRGVYAPGLFALQIVPQPTGNVGFVSTEPGTATLFQLAGPGVVGLLGHNVLDGAKFLLLKQNQEVRLVYGNGVIQRYQVEEIHDFQRLDRASLVSDFIDTQTGSRLTSQQVFDWFYQGGVHLTFQTCIARDGLLDWGVRFIVAKPLP